jgi:asparagine synthase (glutamine-hydrolysing)
MRIPALLRSGVIERLVKALPDSRDIKVMEYIRRLKKFIAGTRGSFPERLLAWKEIFPMEVRDKLLLKRRVGQNGDEEDLPLSWVKGKMSAFHDDRINQILYSDVVDSLPGDMLTKVDWMSMKNSLEVRVPLLDHRVAESAFSISGDLKLHRGKTKYLLKETFKDLLPPSLYRRPKAGFEIPIGRWLKGDMRSLIDTYLSAERIHDQRIFDYQIVNKLKQDLFSVRRDTSWMLWNLIVFQYWHEHYLK